MGGTGKGKGKGKGKESFAEKTTRLDSEISAAAAVQDPDALMHLWSVREGHMNSNWRHESSYAPKGKGKGKGNTESAKVQALRTELKEAKGALRDKSQERRGRSRSKDRQRSKSRDRSSSKSRGRAGGSRGRSRSNSVRSKTKEEKAEGWKVKREETRSRKAKEKEERDGAPRETRFCPACTYDGTYATSVRCYKCRVSFDTAAPTPTPAPAAAPTPAATTPPPVVAAGLEALVALKTAATERTKSYADATKAKVTFVAAATPPPPPLPTQIAPMDTSDATASKLTALRAKRAGAVTQAQIFADAPAVLKSFEALISDIDQQINTILVELQQKLDPTKLCLMLNQRQKESAAAQKALTEARAADVLAVEDFDKHALAQQKQLEEEVRLLLELQSTATATNTAAREALLLEQAKRLTVLQTADAAATSLLTSAQNAYAVKGGTQQAAAAATAAAAALQVAVAAAGGQPVVAPTSAAAPPRLVTGAILPMASLPEPIVVPDDDMHEFALTHRVLEHHSIQDRDFPLRFDNLGFKHSVVAKIVGTTIWTECYPGEAPKPTDFVLRRVLGALKVGLNRIAIASKACEDVDEQKVADLLKTAGEAYDAWRGGTTTAASTAGENY